MLPQASQQEDSAEPSSTGSSETNDAQPLVRDTDNVLSCLKRALKIANAAQQQLAVALKTADTAPAFLYVEILNQYLYYFEQGLPNITPTVVQVSCCEASIQWYSACYTSVDTARQGDLIFLVVKAFVRGMPQTDVLPTLRGIGSKAESLHVTCCWNRSHAWMLAQGRAGQFGAQ